MSNKNIQRELLELFPADSTVSDGAVAKAEQLLSAVYDVGVLIDFYVEVKLCKKVAGSAEWFKLQDLLKSICRRVTRSLLDGRSLDIDRAHAFTEVNREYYEESAVCDGFEDAMRSGAVAQTPVSRFLMGWMASTPDVAKKLASSIKKEDGPIFLVSFADHIRPLIETLKANRLDVGESFLEVVASILSPEDAAALMPRDFVALTRLATRFPPQDKEAFFAQMDASRRPMWYGVPKCEDYFLEAAMDLVVAVGRDLGRAAVEHMKGWRFKQPLIATSLLCASSPWSEQGDLESAFRVLAKGGKRRVVLRSPFAIPEKESGAAFCRLLVCLANCVSFEPGSLSEVPSREDIGTRSFETQVSNPDLFHAACEAIDRLNNRNGSGKDNLLLLAETLPEFKQSHERPEAVIIERGFALVVAPGDLGALVRLLTVYETVRSPEEIWGKVPLTEAMAGRLLDELRRIEGYAQGRETVSKVIGMS